MRVICNNLTYSSILSLLIWETTQVLNHFTSWLFGFTYVNHRDASFNTTNFNTGCYKPLWYILAIIFNIFSLCLPTRKSNPKSYFIRQTLGFFASINTVTSILMFLNAAIVFVILFVIYHIYVHFIFIYSFMFFYIQWPFITKP